MLTALRPQSTGVAWRVLYTTRDSSTTYYHLITNVNGANINWYKFDKVTPPPSSGYGMNLYDGSGNVTYTASQNMMRVKQILSWGTSSTVNTQPPDQNASSGGRAIAAIQGNTMESGYGTGPGFGEFGGWNGNWYLDIVRFESDGSMTTGLQFNYSITSDPRLGPDWVNYGQRSVMIVDVTGY